MKLQFRSNAEVNNFVSTQILSRHDIFDMLKHKPNIIIINVVLIILFLFKDTFEGMTGHIAFDNNGQRFNFTILLTEVSVYKNRLKEVCNLVSTGYIDFQIHTNLIR